MVTKRLGEYLKYKGISFYAIENDLHASRGSISKAVKENKNIGSAVLENILILYTDLNPMWLMTGQGKMLKEQSAFGNISGNIIAGNGLKVSNVNMVKGNHNITESSAKPVSLYIKENLVEVPFVSQQATATFIETCCNDNYDTYETMLVSGVTEEEVKRHKYVVFEVEGNSMEPTVYEKSRILTKFIDPADWEYSTGVHVVCYRDSLVIKRIKKNDLIMSGTLTLHSDNPKGGETTLRKGDIRGMWKALYAVYQKIE